MIRLPQWFVYSGKKRDLLNPLNFIFMHREDFILFSLLLVDTPEKKHKESPPIKVNPQIAATAQPSTLESLSYHWPIGSVYEKAHTQELCSWLQRRFNISARLSTNWPMVDKALHEVFLWIDEQGSSSWVSDWRTQWWFVGGLWGLQWWEFVLASLGAVKLLWLAFSLNGSIRLSLENFKRENVRRNSFKTQL